jgi:hypothetical protein
LFPGRTRPLSGGKFADDRAQQRRLPAPIRSHQRHALPAPDFEVGNAQQLHATSVVLTVVRVRISHGQPFDLQHQIGAARRGAEFEGDLLLLIRAGDQPFGTP